MPDILLSSKSLGSAAKTCVVDQAALRSPDLFYGRKIKSVKRNL